MEPEIIELNVQRAGMEKIGLRAELIDLSQDVRRLVIAWPVGSEERNFDALDFHECLRAFRRVIDLTSSAFSVREHGQTFIPPACQVKPAHGRATHLRLVSPL